MDFVKNLPGKLTEWIVDLAEKGVELGESFVEGIKDGVENIVGFVEDVGGAILQAFKDGWNWVADQINNFIPNDVGFDTPFGRIGVDLPDNPMPKFHTGGVVPGAFGQEVPAILQAGETVRTRQQEAALQRALAGGAGGASGGVTFTGPVTFGGDMREAVSELEWMTRYSMGVAA